MLTNTQAAAMIQVLTEARDAGKLVGYYTGEGDWGCAIGLLSRDRRTSSAFSSQSHGFINALIWANNNASVHKVTGEHAEPNDYPRNWARRDSGGPFFERVNYRVVDIKPLCDVIRGNTEC